MRRTLVILCAVTGLTLGLAVPAQAAAGFRERDYVVKVGAATATARTWVYRLDGPQVRMRNATEGIGFAWNTDLGSGKFRMNAICLDVEVDIDTYHQWFCIGGSSTTLDDVATAGTATFENPPFINFNPNDSPAFRVRFYGVGSGAIENRVDDFATIG